MNLLRPYLLLGGLLVAGTALAQWPLPSPPPALPRSSQSPLLYVRFNAPAGTKISFFQGRAPSRTFDTPAVVGMRPGYCYRVKLTNIPDMPGVTLYPSIEVRGSLHLQPRFGPAKFPATVELNDFDMESAIRGSLVTKIVYLESPDRASPQATKPGQILETSYPVGADLYHEARNRGRIMMVVHLGQRHPTEQELITTNVPGTILLPGEKVVGLPSAPPCIQGIGPGFFDPRIGPRPLTEECVHDGGDRGPKAAFDREGKLAGLDPEDTVAEYVDARGKRQVIHSNTVCLCVPRFAALRTELPLSKTEGVFGPQNKSQVKRNELLRDRQPSVQSTQMKKVETYLGKSRPSENVSLKGTGTFLAVKVLQAQHVDLGLAEAIGTKRVQNLSPAQRLELLKQMKFVRAFSQVEGIAGTEQVKGTSVVGRVEGGPEVISSALMTRDLTVCCNEAPIPPDKPLVLFKCADRGAAQVGDVVTFTLRYSNVGGRAMTDVAIADSLSPRLEYVAGSAVSDRDAVFTAQPNEAGSVILRWEITGKLLPGQSGRVKFQARVR